MVVLFFWTTSVYLAPDIQCEELLRQLIFYSPPAGVDLTLLFSRPGLLGEMIADELEEEARAKKDNESLTQEEIWDDESLK
jgi:hypothetical protein